MKARGARQFDLLNLRGRRQQVEEETTALARFGAQKVIGGLGRDGY